MVQAVNCRLMATATFVVRLICRRPAARTLDNLLASL